MNTIELFAGAGGMATGFYQSGYNHLQLLEFDTDACATLRFNYPSVEVLEKDIRSHTFDTALNADLIIGGPPCQPFSIAGKKLAYDDSRDMFPHAIRSIKQAEPKAFLFENVKGLLSQRLEPYFKFIILQLKYALSWSPISTDWKENLNDLEKLESNHIPFDYSVQFKCLNAADFGVPQQRHRVIITGIRSDINRKWIWPKQSHSKDRLLWDQYVSKNYWAEQNIPVPEQANNSRYESMLIKKYGMFAPTEKPWMTLRSAIGYLPDPRSNHGILDHVFQPGARSYPGHTGSVLDWPSKTLKAGAHGVPGGENTVVEEDGNVRYLTIHEAKLVQTFPSNYVIEGSWTESMRQIGNAVPVLLAKTLADQMASILN